MRNIFRNTPAKVDEENPYWASFSDLMSALLVIFILAAVALIIELMQVQQKIKQDMEQLRKTEDQLAQQKLAATALIMELTQAQQKIKQDIEQLRKAEDQLAQQKLTAVALITELTQTQQKINQNIEQLRNAEKARKDILYEIRDKLAQQKIVVQIVDNDTVLRIPENTLTFVSNSYDLPEDEDIRTSVKIIGEVLHKAINKHFDPTKNELMRFEYLDTVFVEGHTDSLPTQRIKGNWGLSTFRAISLWDFWKASLSLTPRFNDMTNAFNQKLFSVSGYAESRRIQEIEITPEQRRRNRRIDIRFTVKRPSIAQLEEIIDR